MVTFIFFAKEIVIMNLVNGTTFYVNKKYEFLSNERVNTSPDIQKKLLHKSVGLQIETFPIGTLPMRIKTLLVEASLIASMQN